MEPTLCPINIMARRLGVDRKWLRQQAEAGLIPGVSAGKTWLFDIGAVEQVLRERAKLTVPVVSVADMLRGLRSQDFGTRVLAGRVLALSLGVGMKLQGFSELDVEHGAGKDLSALLGRAMAGEIEAVDLLERAIGDRPPTEAPRRNAAPRSERREEALE